MSFFAEDQESSCQASDISQGLVLTTSSLPSSYTCFNLTDIFSQSNDTGFQNGSQPIYDYNGDLLEPNGVSWQLQNQDVFDSKANYSRVWYEQMNQTGDIKAGKDAPWVLYIYAFPDCEQVGGDDFDQDDYPWFETSCQTEPEGECQEVPYPIKSFAILSAAGYNGNHGGCETWAYMGAAATIGHGVWRWVAASASMTALFLLL